MFMFQSRQEKDVVVDVDVTKNEPSDIHDGYRDHKDPDEGKNNEDRQHDTITTKPNPQNDQSESKEREEIEKDDNDQEEELQDLERRIAFTDAVVAVALTLLILPLMDAAGEEEEGDDDDGGTAAWFQENKQRILSFLLSFAAIGAFWKSHDRLFSRLAHCTPWLSFLNFTWMLTIVFTPISTELIHRSNNDSSASESLQHFVYIGNMALINALYCLMIGYVRRRPILWKKKRNGGSILRALFIEGCVDLGLLILALAISTTSSESGYLSLLLLLLGPLVVRVVYWIQPSLRE